MLRLVTNAGNDDERAVDVRVGATTIGRTKDNDVFVLHKSLSRQHARLEHDGKATFIVDLDSKNGTFVNGARVVGAERMSPGDILRVGETDLRVEED